MTVPPGEVDLLTETHDAVDLATEASGEIKGRSPWAIAWRKLRRDKVAITGGVVVVLLILLAALAKPIEKVFGLDPNAFHNNQFQKGGNLIDPNTGLPRGSFGGVSIHHLLGVEPQVGRDILARIIEGAWVSLLVATLATLLSVVIGVLMGVIAGYYGGWVDAVISRTMDIFLAFPLLLFAIAISAPLQSQSSSSNPPLGLSGATLNIVVLVFVIGFFNWPYMGRIIRGQTLSLREREFVDAARSLGARGPYILFKELLPNLVAPVIVYSTLLIPTNILFEAALDFLGVGIQLPQASWGGMLANSVSFYQNDPMYMIVPGAAIFITVLAFNLLGDGLRDALDPKTGR
jgi:peptide/nickel transport system permease protein